MSRSPSTLGLFLSHNGGVVVAAGLYVLMYVVWVLTEPSAASSFAITNLFNNTIVLALAAAGLTLVILCGEFDLSSVGVIAIANVVVATQSTVLPAGSLLSLVAVCLIGLVVGVINGWLIAFVGLQSLACTIGTMIVCQGIALVVLAAPGGQVADAIAYGLTDTVLSVIPVAALLILAVAVAWLLFKRTRLGVTLYAVGTDAGAAQLSGLDVRMAKLAAFAIAGVAYALAGYMLSAQTGTGDPRVSSSFLLYVFAAVAIGGTSFEGGRGGVIGSLFGAGILTIMQKMLFALGVATFYTNIFNGVIMVAAILIGNSSVLLDRFSARQSTATRAAGSVAQRS